MATQRGEVREGRLERQGTGFLQQGQSGKTRIESTSTRGRLTPRLFLRKNDWDEEKINQREDGQRPELTHKQEPSGLEMLIWQKTTTP
jgi:hypothetical protein